VANRAIIAGLVLPAWVDFNVSIRKAIESLSLAGKLAEHANEALAKSRIGPGARPPVERGLGGEVVTEAEARAATEAGIAAKSLEATRKVKDERIKIARETTKGVSDADKELEAAQREHAQFQKQLNDSLIDSMEDLSKELNAAILAAGDPEAFAKWKFSMIEFANFMTKEIDGIIQDIARLAQPIPGAPDTSKGIPGLPSAEEVQAQLDAIHESLQPTFLDKLNDAFEQSGLIIGDWGKVVTDILVGLADALQTTFENFILTGKFGADAFRRLAASILASVAIQAGIKAIFEIAEAIKENALGVAALILNPAAAAAHFTSAALHKAAAIQYGVVAGVAGGIGIGIGLAGGLGGGGATAAAGGGGFGGGEAEPSQVNINLGGARRDTLGIQIATLNQSVEGLHAKITSMPAGDVVMIAADQKPEAFATGTLEAGRRSGAFTREFMQISGARA
jgi:hypothetical protein